MCPWCPGGWPSRQPLRGVVRTLRAGRGWFGVDAGVFTGPAVLVDVFPDASLALDDRRPTRFYELRDNL